MAETYHKILAHVSKAALESADIRYETKVVAIHTRDNLKGKPGVTVQGGETEEFDEVVVTTPLGWLKRNKDAFKPGLSPEMVKAVDSLGYGSLDKVGMALFLLHYASIRLTRSKVYITFPKAFWEEKQANGHQDHDQDKNKRLSDQHSNKPNTSTGIDDKKTTPNVTATTQPLHQSSSHSTSSSTYPGFTHWISPHYSPSNPGHWDQEAMNLSALPGTSSHPTLLFYIYGPCASHIGSILSSSRSPTESDAALLDFFHPYISRLPNYSPSNPACVPKAVLATNWVSDEFAGYGSYCNFQVGLEDGDRCVEVLRKGIPEHGVWFAGEHTAPFVALGTSTGAWWSGEGVGRRIVGGEEGGKGTTG